MFHSLRAIVLNVRTNIYPKIDRFVYMTILKFQVIVRLEFNITQTSNLLHQHDTLFRYFKHLNETFM